MNKVKFKLAVWLRSVADRLSRERSTGISAESESTWISVKRELPDKYDWVFVILKDKRDGFIGLPQVGELRNDGFWHTTESDTFNTSEFRENFGTTDALGVFLQQEVVAWKPIPEFKTRKTA